MTNTTYPNSTLVKLLLELADELDKGDNGDIFWLKYQGETVRRAATVIHYNYSDDQMPETWKE